ncbi:major facilitator superfamily permease [Desulfosporosinus acidiphilus SJ4]|uniref:Major facilitator superfamily permease n=1 Tax=Desulfosporosinus acidiphilus (strain DSM 22704 / JCM 16185 / SJ4) TaxID=646529 RepID=I4D721_DESAJ|nr:MFS transporter [Desulfosporosinus acidiphilus]AFM41595.1 major facilitator superfamily permease [Desulfosporosinus acidiphilus SJ4]
MFNIVVLGIVSLLTDISSEMVYPLLPIFLTMSLGASPAIVGVIEGIAESIASLLKVFSGYWGDKTKKKKELAITGYSSSFLGKIILVLAGTWSGVLVSRILDRLGKGIRTAPRDSLIADSAQEKSYGKAFGLHRAMDTFGAVIGVLIAYFLLLANTTNFKRIFLFSGIPALLGVIVLFFVRQPREINVGKKKLSFAWSSLDKKLKAFLILAFIFNLGNSSNQFLLLRANKLGASAPLVVLLYLVYNISYGILSYPMASLSDRIGRKRILVTGYFIYAFVYLGFALVTKLSGLWTLFAFYGLYIAFTEGVEKALLAEIAPTHLRGTVIGLHATLVGLALLPASLIAGLLWDFFGAAVPFYFGASMGLLSAIGLALILNEKASL